MMYLCEIEVWLQWWNAIVMSVMSTTSDILSILLQHTCDANYEVNSGELVELSFLYVYESMLHCFNIDST